MLSADAIKKFQTIYAKEFGVEISEQEAAEQAQRLLNLARVVMQPMPKQLEARYRELSDEQLGHETIKACKTNSKS